MKTLAERIHVHEARTSIQRAKAASCKMIQQLSETRWHKYTHSAAYQIELISQLEIIGSNCTNYHPAT
jgi:uncharacterized membrane protein